MTTRKDLVGTPCPNAMEEAKRIHAETGVGMNRALQLATEIVREWALANGMAK